MAKLTLPQAQNANLTVAANQRDAAQSMLTAAGIDGDLKPVIVPYGYAVGFIQTPGSSLTLEQLNTLAAQYGLTVFVPIPIP